MKRTRDVLTGILAIIFFIAPYTFANDEIQWKYSKEVRYKNQEEVKAIYLDEEIYRYAKEDLSDIRLINEKGRFIPYYIYNTFLSTNEVGYTQYASKEILSFMEKNDYYVDYEINAMKENMDVIGNKLKLDVFRDNFYKEVQVYGSYDNENWNNIKSDIIYSVDGLEKTEVLLDDAYKYLIIE